MIIIDSENPVGTNRIKLIYTCINLLPFPMSQMYFYFIFFEVIRLFQKSLMPITNTMKRTEVVKVLVWLGCSKRCIRRQLLHMTHPFLLKRGKQYSSRCFWNCPSSIQHKQEFHTPTLYRETHTLFLSFQLCSEIVIMFKRKSQEYFLSNKFMCVLNFLIHVLYCK